MIKYYDYVAQDYKIKFGIGGDWFEFNNGNLIISGDLKNGDWVTGVHIMKYGCYYGPANMKLVDLPYETLVSFRKALAIKGLEYVLDKEITLVGEK